MVNRFNPTILSPVFRSFLPIPFFSANAGFYPAIDCVEVITTAREKKAIISDLDGLAVTSGTDAHIRAKELLRIIGMTIDNEPEQQKIIAHALKTASSEMRRVLRAELSKKEYR